jgi:GNAT superfamily N-acetyltransferase
MPDSLSAVLAAAAGGRYPPPDGAVTIVPQPSARDAGVIGFTAHAVVFTDADPGWVRGQLPAGDLAAPLTPAFLQSLCQRTGRHAHSIDMVCVAAPLPGPPPAGLVPHRDRAHPRIARALRYRDDVRCWRADGGVVVLGRGIGGRWEASVEVDAGRRGHGLGRELALAARRLVPGRAPVWAQIAPGNAASVRVFLAAGYRPVAAEALLTASRQ